MSTTLPKALLELGSEIFSEDELTVYSRYMKSRRQPVDWSHPVLLVIDASEAFLGPNLPTIEASAVGRTACGHPAWEALGKIRGLVEAFRRAGGDVVYTIPDWENDPHFGGTTIGTGRSSVDRLAPGLEPSKTELLLRKPKASAFFATALPTYLKLHDASVIVLTGGTTSGCVRASAIDGSSLGWDVVMAVDACFDRSDVSHRVAAFELGTKYARVLNSSEIEAELDGTLEATR